MRYVIVISLSLLLMGCYKSELESATKENSQLRAQVQQLETEMGAREAAIKTLQESAAATEQAVARNRVAAEQELASKAQPELALSDGMPLRAEKPISPLSTEKLPPSFAWLANLPFGVSEKQFTDTFKSAKCYKSLPCVMDNLYVQCLQGFKATCKVILLTFNETRGLVGFSAEYKSRTEFLPVFTSLKEAFGKGTEVPFDRNFGSVATTKGFDVKWEIDGASLGVNVTDGVDISGGAFTSHVFSVHRK